MIRGLIVALCASAAAGFMSPIAPVSKMARSKVAQMSVVDEVMDKLKAMTLLEASELVKQIEETFDVDASAGGGAPAAAEEKTEFDLVLESFPADKKIAVLKAAAEEKTEFDIVLESFPVDKKIAV